LPTLLVGDQAGDADGDGDEVVDGVDVDVPVQPIHCPWHRNPLLYLKANC